MLCGRPATERKLSALLADFEEVPVEKLKPHQHLGVEFMFERAPSPKN